MFLFVGRVRVRRRWRSLVCIFMRILFRIVFFLRCVRFLRCIVGLGI